MLSGTKFESIVAYHATFPPEVKHKLIQMHDAVLAAAPQAEACISYNMPAFKYHGILVYYAAFKNHIGFYPTASGIASFADELKSYKTSKGAIQFPLDKPIPVSLVKKIVAFRKKENEAKASLKRKKL
jgi:uncharacterized protein YdhG (YjbR/CyaY superfamily)